MDTKARHHFSSDDLDDELDDESLGGEYAHEEEWEDAEEKDIVEEVNEEDFLAGAQEDGQFTFE